MKCKKKWLFLVTAIVLALLVAVVLIVKTLPEKSNSYMDVVEEYIEAYKKFDLPMIWSTYPEAHAEEYSSHFCDKMEELNQYSENKLLSLMTRYGDDLRITHSIEETRVLTEEECAECQKYLEQRYDAYEDEMTEGYWLRVMIYYDGCTGSGNYEFELKVGRIEGTWYVIESTYF